ncbi:MAG: N-acetylglucosaminyldiphosphoundecaprenol N-acetyl-beta-D-mannosaminyltransferase [Cryomorphaceae bacterium]|jgi:N-acetylglucosaminyldiphosphoundecaprenol N-acetyl-beta-D-mannosaminyltransferase
MMRKLIGSIIIAALLPKVAWSCFSAWSRHQKLSIFSHEFCGVDKKKFTNRRLMVAYQPLADIDLWLNYIKGNLDLIGPRAIELSQAIGLDSTEQARFKVAPGILTPFQIKKTAGLAYQEEFLVDAELVKTDSGFRRLQLFVTWILQNGLRAKRVRLLEPKRFELFGVGIDNLSMYKAVETVTDAISKGSGRDGKNGNNVPAKFAFVNADCANQYYKNNQYQDALNRFDGVFPDGIGVKIAAKWLGIGVKENINGTDMFPLLCSKLNKNTSKVYLLGASTDVISAVVSKLAIEYPDIQLMGARNGYFTDAETGDVCEAINNSQADLLLLAMGAPKQELWMEQFANSLNVKAIMGVGGLFDFYSGSVSRAPIWMRELTLEWLWRLAVQPSSKAKRYLLGNPLFLFRAARKSQRLNI